MEGVLFRGFPIIRAKLHWVDTRGTLNYGNYYVNVGGKQIRHCGYCTTPNPKP